MKSGDDRSKKKHKKEKDLLKKRVLIISLLCFTFFLLGGISSYYLNPKCGDFGAKTKYILNGVRKLIETEDPIQIVETPIEYDCPVYDETQEQEEDICPIRIDISGAVKRPGVYCFESGSVIQDAVDIANGFDTAYGYK